MYQTNTKNGTTKSNSKNHRRENNVRILIPTKSSNNKRILQRIQRNSNRLLRRRNRIRRQTNKNKTITTHKHRQNRQSNHIITTRNKKALIPTIINRNGTRKEKVK